MEDACRETNLEADFLEFSMGLNIAQLSARLCAKCGGSVQSVHP